LRELASPRSRSCRWRSSPAAATGLRRRAPLRARGSYGGPDGLKRLVDARARGGARGGARRGLQPPRPRGATTSARTGPYFTRAYARPGATR
jgi:hypothetical protein